MIWYIRIIKITFKIIFSEDFINSYYFPYLENNFDQKFPLILTLFHQKNFNILNLFFIEHLLNSSNANNLDGKYFFFQLNEKIFVIIIIN
jgi:hypothetical protein